MTDSTDRLKPSQGSLLEQLWLKRFQRPNSTPITPVPLCAPAVMAGVTGLHGEAAKSSATTADAVFAGDLASCHGTAHMPPVDPRSAVYGYVGGGQQPALGYQQPAQSQEALMPPVGRKYDGAKAPVAQGFVAYFRKAMEAVANISKYGKEKYKVEYADQNWRKVENAEGRYLDALVRHVAAHASGERLDPESGLPHMAHAAWNALAVLELTHGS